MDQTQPIKIPTLTVNFAHDRSPSISYTSSMTTSVSTISSTSSDLMKLVTSPNSSTEGLRVSLSEPVLFEKGERLGFQPFSSANSSPGGLRVSLSDPVLIEKEERLAFQSSKQR